MLKLSLDFETRSPVNLGKAGVHVYAEHPETDLLCMGWAFGDEPPRVWYPGDPFPEEIADRVPEIEEVRAWNAQFERVIWREVLAARYGVPVPKLEQFVDTMAEATAMGFPRALGKTAKILRVPVQKDMEGRRLMLRMAKPRKDGTYHDDPEDLRRVGQYCVTDVETEREVAKRLLRLPPGERETYLLDQRINDRGIRLDVPLVRAAKRAVDEEMERVNAEIEALTGESATAVTQVQKIREWIEAQGVEIEDLTKQTVIELLQLPDLPEPVRRVLMLRQEAGRTSVGKLDAMLAGISRDNRLRGLLIYHAASTGRWAGVRVQPQNFPRPVFDARPFIPHVLDGASDLIALEQPVIETISYMLRNMLIASEGCRLVAGDYSQIEARVVHWIAGQEWEDHPYERMAARIYGASSWEEIGKGSLERQIGKNVVLGAGFQMGAKKFIDYVYKATGIRISLELAERAITDFREAKHRIVDLWYDLDRAFRRAILAPGSVQTAGVGMKVRYVVRGQYLFALLPSGRRLTYALPRIVPMKTPWGEVRPTPTFMGINTHTRKWSRNPVYGGFLTENLVQAVARDIMVHGMKQVEAAGYPVVLTVHDEVVTDTPEGHGSLEEFLSLMTNTPRWAEGCPVEAEGWEGQRWRK